MINQRYQILERGNERDLFLFVLIVGIPIIISSFAFTEFVNNENSIDNKSTFEEVPGDILNPTHPFQVEQRSTEVKKAAKEIAKVATLSEGAIEYFRNLPEAAGPEIPNGTPTGTSGQNNPNTPGGNTATSNPPKISDSTNPTYKVQVGDVLGFTETGTISEVFPAPPESKFDIPQETINAQIQTVMENCNTKLRPGVDLRGCDLRGVDLRQVILIGANLEGADLRDADLRGADLSTTFLRVADFRNADLRGADLSSADLGGANFAGADLSGADLRGAVFDASRTQFPYQKWFNFDPDFTNANLSDANISHSNVKGNFKDANLHNTDFSNSIVCCELNDAKFSNTNFSESIIYIKKIIETSTNNVVLKDTEMCLVKYSPKLFDDEITCQQWR